MKQSFISRTATRLVAFQLAMFVLVAPNYAMSDEERPLPSVTVSKAMLGDIEDRVPIAGSLVAKEEVLIFPQVSGFPFEKVNYDIGDIVKSGDVLAVVNSQTLSAQFAQADAEFARSEASVRQAMSKIESSKASAAQADAALTRSKKLQGSGTVTQATLDQAIATSQTSNANLTSAIDGVAVAEAQLKQAKAMREIARLNLKNTSITSPVDGLISARNVQIGSIATSGGVPNFRIIANGVIELKAEIIETALGNIKIDNPVELDIAGVGENNGSVRLISPSVDPISRLGMIRIAVSNALGLRTGLFASGWLITDKRTSLSVPNRAVLSDTKGQYVFIVEQDGTISRRAVIAGAVWQERREVLNGLKIGETVIAKAGAFFTEGDKISPVLEKNSATSGDEK